VKLTTHLHLVPRSKNEWSYTSTPHYAFMAWCLVKHRNNFTFIFYFIIKMIISGTRRGVGYIAGMGEMRNDQEYFGWKT
jgi:hypothetical protein